MNTLDQLAWGEVEPWQEPVDGKVLLDGLAGVLQRYVVLPPWAAETLALWTLHTYAFPLRCAIWMGRRCGGSLRAG